MYRINLRGFATRLAALMDNAGYCFIVALNCDAFVLPLDTIGAERRRNHAWGKWMVVHQTMIDLKTVIHVLS